MKRAGVSIMGAMPRANSTQPANSRCVVPPSGISVPPLRTAAARSRAISFMRGSARKFMAAAIEPGDRRSKKCALSSVRRYVPSPRRASLRSIPMMVR
jgi:hypothetical protein